MSEYIAGFNQPGYLPDNTPEEFESFDEAKRFILDEMQNSADNAGDGGDEELAEDMEAILQDVNLENSPFSVLAPDGYAYWVANAEDTAKTGAWESLDDDEDDEDDEDY